MLHFFDLNDNDLDLGHSSYNRTLDVVTFVKDAIDSRQIFQVKLGKDYEYMLTTVAFAVLVERGFYDLPTNMIKFFKGQSFILINVLFKYWSPNILTQINGCLSS